MAQLQVRCFRSNLRPATRQVLPGRSALEEQDLETQQGHRCGMGFWPESHNFDIAAETARELVTRLQSRGCWCGSTLRSSWDGTKRLFTLTLLDCAGHPGSKGRLTSASCRGPRRSEQAIPRPYAGLRLSSIAA